MNKASIVISPTYSEIETNIHYLINYGNLEESGIKPTNIPLCKSYLRQFLYFLNFFLEKGNNVV